MPVRRPERLRRHDDRDHRHHAAVLHERRHRSSASRPAQERRASSTVAPGTYRFHLTGARPDGRPVDPHRLSQRRLDVSVRRHLVGRRHRRRPTSPPARTSTSSSTAPGTCRSTRRRSTETRSPSAAPASAPGCSSPARRPSSPTDAPSATTSPAACGRQAPSPSRSTPARGPTPPATSAPPARRRSRSIEPLQAQADGTPPPGKVFFIDISGGMYLRLGDLFDEPILEIRGKVSLEIGKGADGGVAVRAHGLRDDQGHQARQPRLGRGDVRPPDRRQPRGHRALGRRSLLDELRLPPHLRHRSPGPRAARDQHDEPRKTEKLSLEGIPGGVITSFTLAARRAPDRPLQPGRARQPAGTRSSPTDRATRTTITIGTGQKFTTETFHGFTPTDATIEGISLDANGNVNEWRDQDVGRPPVVDRQDRQRSTAARSISSAASSARTTSRRTRSRSRSRAESRSTTSTTRRPSTRSSAAGSSCGSRPARLEFFVTAAGTIGGVAEGRAIGLLIVDIAGRPRCEQPERDPRCRRPARLRAERQHPEPERPVRLRRRCTT